MLTKKELEQTIDFVFSREQPEGGFSFAGFMPPTLEDTYYAIKTLKLIEKELNRKIPIKKETIAYIQRIDDDIVDYRLQYQLLWLCEQFKLKPILINRNQFIVSKESYEQLYYYVLLKGKIDENNITLNKPIEKLRYVSDLSFLVLIKKKLKIKFDQQMYVEKIQAIQNNDGGFGFDDGSTSFLENTYLAVKALSALKKEPLLLKECVGLVKGCRANNGGYGRSTSTVPTLQATYMATRCLRFLVIR